MVTPSGTTNTFTVGGTAVAVDSGITVTSNDTDLTGATVTISSGTLQTGDTLNFSTQNGITGSFSGGVLTLSGSATAGQLSDGLAIGHVLHHQHRTATSPGRCRSSLRQLARPAIRRPRASSHRAPVVTPSGTTNTFTIGGSAVAVDSGVTVTSNDADLTGATLTISSGTLQSGDTLNFTQSERHHRQLLRRRADVERQRYAGQYQAALQSVTFSTTSGTLTPRSLTLDVEDTNSVESNVAAETVDVTT